MDAVPSRFECSAARVLLSWWSSYSSSWTIRMQGLQSSSIRKEEYFGQPFVSTQPQEKKTAQGERVERQNNFWPRVFRISANGGISIWDCDSGTGLTWALSDEDIVYRVEAVTACLQAGIPLPVISFQHPNDHHNCSPLTTWISKGKDVIHHLFSHSPASKLQWRAANGDAIISYSAKKWWSWLTFRSSWKELMFGRQQAQMAYHLLSSKPITTTSQ